MARKLIFGNDLTFNASLGTVVVKGIFPVEKILVVNDATTNKPLYSFSDPTTTITCTPNYSSKETTITISSIPAGTLSSDKIQVYIEKEELEIKPSRTYRDPVSKFRVSEGESIIDTDFEYGLQPTKWETLRTVNNIPTYYSSSFSEEALLVESATVSAGSKDSNDIVVNDSVTIITTNTHNLVKGSIVEVSGLTDIRYEGVFVVKSVTDNSFTYVSSIFSTNPPTGNLSTIYTLVYPGSFYTGAGIEIFDANVQTGTASTITVTTPNVHGINPTTKVYLKQTRGTQLYEFNSEPSNLNISDVIGAGTTTQRSIINFDVSSSTTNRTEYWAKLPIIEDNWIGSYEINIPTSSIAASGTEITYNYKNQLGDSNLSPLATGDIITFYTPKGNNAPEVSSVTYGISGSVSFKCFKVLTVNSNSTTGVTTFTVTSYKNGNDPQSFSAGATGTGTTTFGNHRIIKGVRVSSITINKSTNIVTFAANHGFVKGDKVCFATNNSALINGEVTSNDSAYNYHIWTIGDKTVTSPTTIQIAKEDYARGLLCDTNLYTVLSQNQFIIAFKVSESAIPLRNSIYLPPAVGFSTESFETAQPIVLSGINVTTNAGANAAGIPYIVSSTSSANLIAAPSTRIGSSTGIGVTYYLKQVTNYQNWYQIYQASRTATNNDGSLSYNYDLVIPSGNVTSAFKNIYTFNSTLNRKDEHTIRILPSNPFDENDSFKYSFSPGASLINGLTANTSYVTKKSLSSVQNKNVDTNKFRLANSGFTGYSNLNYFEYPTSGPTGKIPAAQKYDYALVILPTTNVSSKDIGIGKYIQITGFSGGTPVANRFINSIFRVNNVASGNFAGITTYNAKGTPVPTNGSFTALLLNIDSVGFNTTTIITTGSKLKASTDAKFTGSQVCGIVTFTSVGSGEQLASIETPGITDGVYQILTTDEKQFEIISPSQIPKISKNIILDVSNVADMNTKVGTGSTPPWIKIEDHNFSDGTELEYTCIPPEYPLTNLSNDSLYYVVVLDQNHIALTDTSISAIQRNESEYIGIGTESLVGITTHTFQTSSIKAFIPGSGFVGLSSNSNVVNGTSTKFLTDFSNGDKLRIYQLNSPTGPGTYFETKITNVKSDTSLQIEEFFVPDESDGQFSIGVNNLGIGTGRYFIPTRIYPMSDAKASHRSFDGGVSMTSGITPNSQIVRQTRRYFRYQSGKGIQCSMAVNFNPTFDIDSISGVGTQATIKTKFTHSIPTTYSSENEQEPQQIQLFRFDKSKNEIDKKILNIKQISDGFTLVGVSTDNTNVPTGNDPFYQYNILNWKDATLKAGMFDDQNGFFFKYDGNKLYAVRRASTQQLSGTVSVKRSSNTVSGNSTQFAGQLSASDRVIIRGQTYKIISISNDGSSFEMQPSYRGQDSDNIVISKVIDTEVPQEEWNIDRCDGTGPSGYNLNINKIQMIYMDYSWYGAGSIRFGFKNQEGEVIYAHEFVHNNDFTESYFRAGNLPARYEIETDNAPGYGPSLFHWGVSVMMDGRFDDDKVYLFTADSNTLPFTNGGLSSDINGLVNTSNKFKVTDINGTEASISAVGLEIVNGSASIFQKGTKISSIEVDTASPKFSQNKYTFTVDKSLLNTGNVATGAFNLSSGTAASLRSFIPLVSIRLAPAVDNASTGNLGFRDIINRMQLTLKSAGILTTHDCEVRLILNSRLSKDNFISVGSPSLAQIYKHEVGDSYSGGISIYSFRAQGGSLLSSTSGRRSLNVTSVNLEELALLGNSILGGDGVYPDGPDILTVAVKPVDTSSITGASPFIVSSRISWAEAQA